MIKRNLLGATLAFVAFSVIFPTSGNCQQQQPTWHQANQLERNQIILYEAFNTPPIGPSKYWVELVVINASNILGGPNTPVVIPQNANPPQDYYWINGVFVEPFGPIDPSQWQQGMIVQFRSKSSVGYIANTAIVISNCPVCQSVTLMGGGNGLPGTVGFYQQSYQAFKAALETPTKFMVYEIF